MKQAIFILIFISFCLSAWAQIPQFEWAWSTDVPVTTDNASASVLSSSTDKEGNVLTTGYFRGRIDFNQEADSTILDSGNDVHIFVQKLDTDGNFLWAVSMGNSEVPGSSTIYSRAYAITSDTLGNVYITGSFQGTVDFDPGPSVANLVNQSANPQNSSDIFVLKLDTDGNYVWAKRMGGWFFESGRAISVDDAENVYVTGMFRATVDFDPGPGVAELSTYGYPPLDDAFVVKLNADGDYQWSTAIGTEYYDAGWGIANDKDGNVYTTGYYTAQVDFDPGTDTMFMTSEGGRDIFVQKLDTDGNLVWAKSIGGDGSHEGYAITVDDLNNVYLTGFFHEAIDADPGPDTTIITAEGYRNPFIIKLDGEGDFVWGKSINTTTSNNRGYGIVTDSDYNVYTVGIFDGIADFDPGIDSFFLEGETGKGAFIQKLDEDGDFVWAACLGGQAEALSVDASCNIFIAGQYASDTIDFDPGPDTYYLTESGPYLAKFSGGSTACLVSVSSPEDALTISFFPNPNFGQFEVRGITQGTYQIYDTNGRTIQSGELKNDASIDISRESQGMYFISFYINNKIYTKKIIKV